MGPKRTIIGDARDEMDPKVRAERDGEWEGRNMGTRNPSSLGASRWNPSPARTAAPAANNAWRLGETRQAIFARMESLERKALDRPSRIGRENTARRKVYEDMYARGCGSGDAAAITINVEYFVDAKLWTDHVQRITKEEFPWGWPDIYREDTGYAGFIESQAGRNRWTATVLDKDEVIRVQRQQETAETEAKLKAEGKDWADMAAPIKETHLPSTEDKDGKRVVGEPQLVVRTKPEAAEPAKAEAGGKAVAKAEDTPWSPEQMTELYEEMFGGEAPRLDGMGGFELPMEASLAAVVTKSSVGNAGMLFPASVEIRPVELGWGRVKLCLRFASWVARGQTDFPVHKYYLVWSWCMLLKWKGRLLKQASGAEEVSEPPASMYDGIRWVVDHWTEQAAKKQADLSLVDEAWGLDARADMAGLEDEASKQRLYDAVSKVLASSRGQDDETRACAVVDWAGADPEKFGAGPRTRTYLAVTAMCRYCESQAGEEKLGMIAQQMKSEKHAAPALLKKRAGQAAKSSKH